MNKRIVFSIFFLLVASAVFTSCSSSLYKRDPYRGSSYNQANYGTYRRNKAKAHRPYRHIKARPSNAPRRYK